jgi:tetratricopeptide (TPR) repeat protein
MADQELTVEAYRRFLESPDHPKGEELAEAARRGDLTHSVAITNWASAILFCNWLSRAEGRTPCYRPDASGRLGVSCDFRANGYRLPTDAEWEYVFRYGTTTRFVTGEDVDRMLDYGRVFGTNYGPGKMFYPNPWGFHDLLGNGWEMCWDSGYAVRPELQINPVGTAGSTNTIRGGAFNAGPFHFHGSFRLSIDIGPQHYVHLVRLVCGPLQAGTDSDEKTAAIDTLSRTLEGSPDSRPQVWKERGRFYADLDQYEKSVSDYSRALELAPNSLWMASDAVKRDEVFHRLASARPGDARLWLARADWLTRQGRWREAIRAFVTALTLAPADSGKDAADACGALELASDPDWVAEVIAQQDELFARVIQVKPTNLFLWAARAECMGRRGRWSEAAKASAKEVEFDPAQAACWFQDAILRLQTGDIEAYRRVCQEMLTRFANPAKHYNADFTAKTCLLLPDSVPDLSPVLKLARRPLVGMEKDVAYPWFLLCRALASYRAGQFAASKEDIVKVAPKPNGGALDATAYVILALAEYRLRHLTEATQALERAQVIRNRNWPQFDRGQQFEAFGWGDWLRCDVLRREAEALLGDSGKLSKN